MDIQELIKQTLTNLIETSDTETVVGKPILGADGTVILPVSKLSFGFVAGGGEYGVEKNGKLPETKASGAGLTVTPVGFLVCGREKKFIAVDKTADNKWMELARAALKTMKGDDDD